MTFYTLWIIALGLSMDAFAVSISKGLALRTFRWQQALTIALCFGLFQGIMPAIGYAIGLQFSGLIQNWDHWIGFTLLTLIGINMIREGFSVDDEEDEEVNASLNLKRLFTLGIATSIDALALGVSFAFLDVNLFTAVLTISLTTFVMSLIGVKSGHFLGKKFKSKAEIFGGLVLISIGFSLLYEHGVFTF